MILCCSVQALQNLFVANQESLNQLVGKAFVPDGLPGYARSEMITG
jgi:hypothetical protein